jgi:hypothetical protein
MTKGTNDNEPLAVGDRVQRRRFPHIQGYVFDLCVLYPGWISIQWDDPEEIAEVPNPRRDLQKITQQRSFPA